MMFQLINERKQQLNFKNGSQTRIIHNCRSVKGDCDGRQEKVGWFIDMKSVNFAIVCCEPE